LEFRIFSKALYSTWILYKPERMLIDAGEGVSTVLGNSVFAVKDVFLTHGHVDHISGLWGLVNTRNNAMGDREKTLRIHYPLQNRRIESLLRFVMEMNPSLRYEMEMTPLQPGQEVFLRQAGSFSRSIIPFRVKHTPSEISYGYHIMEERRKLKEEFTALSQRELSELAKDKGKDAITDRYKKKLVTISGDSYALPVEEINDSETVLHECTFLNAEDRRNQNHAAFDEIMESVTMARGIKRLILYHISSRYSSQISRWKKRAQDKLDNRGIDVLLVHPERYFEI